jgi:hypothetical protein
VRRRVSDINLVDIFNPVVVEMVSIYPCIHTYIESNQYPDRSTFNDVYIQTYVHINVYTLLYKLSDSNRTSFLMDLYAFKYTCIVCPVHTLFTELKRCNTALYRR